MPSRDQARGLGKPSREQIARGVFLFFIVLSLAFAGLSFIQGFLNALNHSQDFQWSPASLFLRRINPYQVYLDGNRADEIILSQVPNYAQLLYVLFAPFGAMPFSIAKAVWAITNICLAIFAPLASARLFSLTSLQAVVAIAIFAMSTPTRNTIGNGQHSLFILAAFLCALLTGEPSSKPRSQRDGLSSTRRFLSPIMAGISYLKYSFAPTLGVAYMRRYGFRYFLYSFLPVLAGIFIF